MTNREKLIKALQENDIASFHELVKEMDDYCSNDCPYESPLSDNCLICEAMWLDLEHEKE